MTMIRCRDCRVNQRLPRQIWQLIWWTGHVKSTVNHLLFASITFSRDSRVASNSRIHSAAKILLHNSTVGLVFALYGWAAKSSCNEKSKTEKSRNFTATNIR